MESPRMDAALGDVERIINALDPKAAADLDLARLCGVLGNLQIHGFQRRHCGRLDELLKRLQSFPRPEILVCEDFFGALAKLYDALVTGDFARREVLSLNLQLLFAIEDLSDHPQGKALSGKHFITRLLTLVCAKSGSLKLKRASVETLCALITRSAENQNLFILHVSGCYKFFKFFLPRCGDFQLQASAAEILFRLTRRHKRLLDIIEADAAKKAMLSMHEMKNPDVKTGIRDFVTLLNESMGTSRSVHSFRALQVLIDGNEDVTHEELWIHIGLYHINYYRTLSTDENVGATEIVDFELKNVKEIKVLQASSSLELIIWKSQDNAAVPTKTIVCFRCSSEDVTLVYDCCIARLSSLKATILQSSSQTPWTGKASIGIPVPLPKIEDFPVMPEPDPNEKTEEAPPPVPATVPEPSPVLRVNPQSATPEERKAEGPRSPSVAEVLPQNLPDPIELEGKENVGQLRNKLKAMLEGTTKSAIKKLKVVQEKSPSIPKASTPPAPTITTPLADQIIHDKPTMQKPDKGLSDTDALRTEPRLDSRIKPKPATKRGPGRPRKKPAPIIRKTPNVESPAIQEKLKAGITKAASTKPRKQRESRLQRDELRKQQDAVSVVQLIDIMTPVRTRTRRNTTRPEALQNPGIDEGQFPAPAINGADTAKFVKEEVMAEGERCKQSKNGNPIEEFGSPTANNVSTWFDYGEPSRFSVLTKEDNAAVSSPAENIAATIDFDKFAFSTTKAMPEEVEIPRPRSRRRRTIAELTNASDHRDPGPDPEVVHTKRRRFESDAFDTKRNVKSESSECLQDQDYCEDGAMNDVLMLFANMINKFKIKLQTRVREKTVLVLSSTSEAIKSEASSVELQIQKDTEDYAQHCRDKLGQIELDMHEISKGFKKICEDFDNSFRHYREQLEQIQGQVEYAEDEFGDLSEKRKLSHRKLIAQLQKRSEERLSEAESKILAIRKAAKRMQGFKEILQQLVMGSIEI